MSDIKTVMDQRSHTVTKWQQLEERMWRFHDNRRHPRKFATCPICAFVRTRSEAS